MLGFSRLTHSAQAQMIGKQMLNHWAAVAHARM